MRTLPLLSRAAALLLVALSAVGPAPMDTDATARELCSLAARRGWALHRGHMARALRLQLEYRALRLQLCRYRASIVVRARAALAAALAPLAPADAPQAAPAPSLAPLAPLTPSLAPLAPVLALATPRGPRRPTAAGWRASHRPPMGRHLRAVA